MVTPMRQVPFAVNRMTQPTQTSSKWKVVEDIKRSREGIEDTGIELPTPKKKSRGFKKTVTELATFGFQIGITNEIP